MTMAGHAQAARAEKSFPTAIAAIYEIYFKSWHV